MAKKFFTIVIPRHKETEKEVFPLLSSIAGQLGVDFSDGEIIVANDGGGSGPLDKNFLSLFDIDIRQIDLKENGGPGVARQAGLDEAKGDYVMFCDADDCLQNVGVLGAMLQEIEKIAPDILSSSWLEEIRDPNGNYIYAEHKQENTWMHGKFLRRGFLTSNGIRFHKDLRIHEDSYFLAIVAAFAEKHNWMPITSYVWKFHENSITRRRSGLYSYESIPTFIRACTMAHKEIEKRKPELMTSLITQFVLYNFVKLHKPDWQAPERAGYLKKAEETLVECIKPSWKYWENAPEDVRTVIYNQERDKLPMKYIETETLDQWLKRIGLS